MSYIINTYNGKKLTIVSDGSVDYTTDLVFIGKNYAGYGESQNQNFLHLLENFARGSSPDRPVTGQLWFDSFTNKLKFYDNNSVWRTASGADILSSKPDYLTEGDFWFDRENNQLYVYSSTGSSSGAAGYVLIGPPNSKTTGKITAIRSVTVYDDTFSPHQILEALIEDNVTFVISYDDEFVLHDTTPIPGFVSIYPGITFTGANQDVFPLVSDIYKLQGTATSSDSLVIDQVPIIGSVTVPTTASKLSVAVRSENGTIYTTNLDVSTTLSGDAFVTYLASPPEIGTALPNIIGGTTVKATGTVTPGAANSNGTIIDYVGGALETDPGTGVISVAPADSLAICPRTVGGEADVINPRYVFNSTGALGIGGGTGVDYGDVNEVLVSQGPTAPPQWLPISSGGGGGGGTADWLYTTTSLVNALSTPGMVVDYSDGGRIFVTANQSITIYRNGATTVSMKIDGDGKVGFNDANPLVSVSINATDAIRVPAGTEAQKPASAVQGYFRYNTEKNYFEGADGSNWTSFGVIPGTIIAYIGTDAPAGYLKCPPTPTYVSRTTYAALFNVLGTAWGTSSPGVDFGLPVFPAGYTIIAGTPGTSSVGQVISHTHTYSKASAGGQKPLSTGTKPFDRYVDATTAASGGTANLAAGVNVIMCIKY